MRHWPTCSLPIAARIEVERQWLSLWQRSDGRLRTHIFRLAGIYGERRSALDTVARAIEKQARPPLDGRGNTPPMPTPRATVSSSQKEPKYVSRVHVEDIANTLLASMSGKLLHTLLRNRMWHVDVFMDLCFLPQWDNNTPPVTATLPPCIPMSSLDTLRNLLLPCTAPAMSAEQAIYNVADDEPATRADVLNFAAQLLQCELPPDLLIGNSESERGRRRLTENKRVRNERMRSLLAPTSLWFPNYRDGLRAIHEEYSR